MSQEVNRLVDQINVDMSKVVTGQREVINLLIVGLLCRGHVLIEGVPGLAKTLLAKTLAFIIRADFTRIQFTPDLMPADILGTSIFDMQTRTFRLRRGPIFTEILLADEVNRTPPKTQSALLEAMEERQISIDGKTISLSKRFMVVATQNPIEQEGTYPLPEAQLDRFFLKIIIDYPSASEEERILSRYGEGIDVHNLLNAGLSTLPDGDGILKAQDAIKQVQVEKGIVTYIQTIVSHTRRSPHLFLGASPRGGIALLRAGQCLAAMEGRDFVTPDDVKKAALPILRHRVILRPEAELEGLTADRILSSLLDGIPVPR